jgi:hypothetical protein
VVILSASGHGLRFNESPFDEACTELDYNETTESQSYLLSLMLSDHLSAESARDTFPHRDRSKIKTVRVLFNI